MEGVCQELRSVSVGTMVDDVTIECTGAVVKECSCGGWFVGVCVFGDPEVIEVLGDGFKTACYLVFVWDVGVDAKCGCWSFGLESRSPAFFRKAGGGRLGGSRRI